MDNQVDGAVARARVAAMSKPQPPRKGEPRPVGSSRVWVLALVLAVGFVAWNGLETFRHYTRISGVYGLAVHAPEPDPHSRTGLADGRRTIAYPGASIDGLHWLMQTQQMLDTGAPRVRHVDEDNAPGGRSSHWGSPFRWWLALCAWVDHAVTGRSPALAVEYAGLWANPALLVVALLAFVPWTARRFGGTSAAWLAFVMVATPAFTVLFAGDNPDHHGLVQVCVMAAVYGVMAGNAAWIRSVDPAPAGWSWLADAATARRAFTISALGGAAGMWVSAASTIPALAGIALGGLGGAWFGRGAASWVSHDAGLWRHWGRVGMLGTLVAYLIEYAPADMGWRLEVNHPLYALAWLGAGEVLAQLSDGLSRGRMLAPRGASWRLVPAFLFLLAPLCVIAFRGERVFAVSDPFLWSLSHDYVPEGRGLLTAMRLAGPTLHTVAECLPLLLVPAAGAWLARRSTPAMSRAMVAVPLSAAALFLAMAFRELRWWTVGYGFLFGIVVVLARVLKAEGRGRQSVAVAMAGIVLFAPGLGAALRELGARPPLVPDDVVSLAERDLAHALRRRSGNDPLVVLGGPATTSRLIYFAGARGLGTPYWENLDGLKRAASIFAARTAAEAHERVQAAGVTHIVLLSWDGFVAPYVRLARGLAADEAITEPAFGVDLLSGHGLPPWLRRVDHRLPPHPALRDKSVIVLEVTDRVQPEHVLVRGVNERLRRGETAAAARAAADLRRHPDDLAAQIALARIARATDDAALFTDALDRADRLRAQTGALEAEDLVGFAQVLASAGLATRARAVLADAWPSLDERALRRLPADSLVALLALAEELRVPWPSAGLRDRAIALVPPGFGP